MRNPAVPESVEGWWILHRIFAVDRRAWLRREPAEAVRRVDEARAFFDELASADAADVGLVALVGHKGDLMVTHYARAYDDLVAAQARFDTLGLREALEPRDSYVSVLELGLYEATGKIHARLREQGLEPGSEAWVAAFDAAVRAEAENPYVARRRWARIPRRRYACFYPMNKRRGERYNWYATPYEERARMMREHGVVGRSYQGAVTQVISGSIGYDDYEWGVDLYADDPLVFKKLVYEMRFDEASARYGEFGPFWSGVQFSPAELGVFLDGRTVPRLLGAPQQEGPA